MDKRINIGVVGDFNERIYTHLALNESVAHCRPQLQFDLETTWIGTEKLSEQWITKNAYNGFWIAPGSPYQNDKGVYQLIRWCRENNIPLLGTCGGFQYMIIEFAANFLGISDTGHEESEPNAERLIITKMECSLKGQQEDVLITDRESWLYEVLRKETITGFFNCSYGVNPLFRNLLNQYPMVFTAFSKKDEPRAMEFKAHKFFCGTLFQPPLDSSMENPNPLLLSFFRKCSG